MNNFYLSFIFLFILCGQSYAQWERTNFPDSVQINSMVVIGSKIIAGSDGAGIFESTDNGENWNEINEGLQSKIIHTIFINGTTIFAGTETGASASTNNGLSWNTINTGLAGLGVWSYAATSDESGDTILFAGVWNGICKSTDNGINWEATGLSNTTMPVYSIYADKGVVIATATFSGLFLSQDYGFTWKNINIIDDTTFADRIVPVISLTKLGNKIVAGLSNGYFYYAYYWNYSYQFNGPFGVNQYNLNITSFASRNDTLFAGDLSGYFFIFDSVLGWVSQRSYWVKHPIYSIVLNDSYLFAGTDNGVWRLWYPETTTNVENFKETPSGFTLEQNYPNPFNSSTKIKFSIPNNSQVSLKVYNVLGELVDDLVDRYMYAGTYEIQFSAADLQSGVYFYSIVTNEFRGTKKLILLK